MPTGSALWRAFRAHPHYHIVPTRHTEKKASVRHYTILYATFWTWTGCWTRTLRVPAATHARVAQPHIGYDCDLRASKHRTFRCPAFGCHSACAFNYCITDMLVYQRTGGLLCPRTQNTAVGTFTRWRCSHSSHISRSRMAQPAAPRICC